MVNGNYVLYGDRSCSESEIVDDHVQTRTAERKVKRKVNRTANELQHSLNQAKLDNETDSVKYEKKIKEPRLLRYIPTNEVEENYITEKFETYDLRATEELPRRHNYTKKPKNPTDGSFHYANSRSSSSCSSPNGNLPTISEQCESYGTYRIRSVQGSTLGHGGFENKLDKYFAKPKDVKTFAAKGSHPDSLYRVATDSSIGGGKTVRALRVLRWPLALFTICVALGVFVYFLVPSNLNTGVDIGNATTWENNLVGVQSKIIQDNERSQKIEATNKVTKKIQPGTKTSEIDFYEAETDQNYDVTTIIDTITEKSIKRKLPVPPVFPSHITPEIQYGNEKADLDKLRSAKLLEEIKNTEPSESTLKPHITQKPEKPLAIYFQDGSPITSSSTESLTITDGFANAESSNGLTGFVDRDSNKNAENEERNPSFDYRETERDYRDLEPIQNIKTKVNQYSVQPDLAPVVQEFYSRPLVRNDGKFTSGHSKVFGISIEEAEHMKATTQHSLYHTRVSPTLPTWRDKEATTKKYADGSNSPDVQQCRSTSQPLCRGILPYDLASPPATIGMVDVSTLLPQIEYLIQTNCSERAIYFACALLEPECSPQPYAPKLPCYNFCKAIVDSCEGSIPTDLGAMFYCNQYSSNNCVNTRAPCLTRELACGDGSCIPRDWVCDGTRDCPAGEDEEPCSTCEQDEYRCASGMCITKRWLCDGYSDCPSGEDEDKDLCRGKRPQARGLTDLGDADLGEESAGSAPAPSIRRPNRVHNSQGRNSGYLHAGENDSSKELLMTSDSNNGFRRNFTRRPSPSRLSPYTRPKPKTTSPEYNDNTTPESVPETTNEPEENNRSTGRFKNQKSSAKIESAEEINLGDLGIVGDENEKIEQETKKPTQIKLKPQGASVTSSPSADQSINKLERYIDGASMLRKAARMNREDAVDSHESNSTAADKSEEMYNSAHASPCPSGDLRCVDGRCISLAQLCDGTIDCSDHADEDNCYT